MGNITEYLSADHKKCDELFADVENDIVDKNWQEAFEKFRLFQTAMEAHLTAEEEILFPRFEQATQNTHGPTYIMRMEHAQMREVMDQIKDSFENDNSAKLPGQMETLMILLQQHNMKEEQMLYPMTDQILGDSSSEITENLKRNID